MISIVGAGDYDARAPARQAPSFRLSDMTEKKPPVEPAALPPAASRALAEAAARRKTRDGKGGNKPPETGGPKGPEPTRYGDWERGGILSDF